MTPRTALALLLGISSLATGAQDPPPAKTPEDRGSPKVEAKVPSEFGRAATASFRERYPGLLAGRVALGWPVSDRDAASAGAAAAEAEPILRPLADLGVAASSAGAALEQLDPGTFTGVLWMESLRVSGGTFAGLSLTLRRPGVPEETKLVLTDLPAPTPHPSPPAQGGLQPTPEPLFRVAGRVRAMTVTEGGGELWYLLGGRLVRRGLSGEPTPQEWSIEGSDAPDAPCVLRFLPEAGKGAHLGWVCGDGGAWLGTGGSGIQRIAPIGGFPLSERESKFLRAPYLPEVGTYALLDYQGKELGTFTGFARTRSASGESILVLLGKDGSVKALHGNTLEPLAPPAEGTFAAVAGTGDLLALAEAAPPHRIRVFRAAEGTAWEGLWVSGTLPGPVQFLALDSSGGRTGACAMLADGDGTLTFLLPLP